MPAVWLESFPFATEGDVIRVIGMHSNQPPKFCSTSLVIINYAIGLSLARTKKANRSDDDSNQSHLSAWSGFLKRLLPKSFRCLRLWLVARLRHLLKLLGLRDFLM